MVTSMRRTRTGRLNCSGNSLRRCVVDRGKSGTYQEGFGIVESLVAGTVLAGVVISALAISAAVESSKYQASLRDAIRQVIDDDIQYLNHRVFAYDFVPAVTSNGSTQSNACYKTHSTCATSQILNGHVQYCRNLANSVINSIGPRSTLLNMNSRSHGILGQSPIGLRRTMTAEKPSIMQGYLQNADYSIIRVTYTVDRLLVNNASPGLLANANREVLRIADLYPDSHAYCNPE